MRKDFIDTMWDLAWRDKETKEFITVSTRSFGCKGCTVKYYLGSGISFELSESKFLEKFEPVEMEGEVRKLGDALVEACLGSTEFKRLAETLLRRLEPGYFEKGKNVYFLKPSLYFKNGGQNYGYLECGVEHPYQIVSYRPHRDSDTTMLLGLVRLGKKTEEPDFEIPVYLDRIESGDAFFCLQRYDKPF